MLLLIGGIIKDPKKDGEESDSDSEESSDSAYSFMSEDDYPDVTMTDENLTCDVLQQYFYINQKSINLLFFPSCAYMFCRESGGMMSGLGKVQLFSGISKVQLFSGGSKQK